MKEIISILMTRDGISKDDAIKAIEECRRMMLDAIECGDDPEEVLIDYLGLEPDYMFEILY